MQTQDDINEPIQPTDTETPAPEPAAADAAPGGEAQEQEQQQESAQADVADPNRKPRGVQARIDEITRGRYEAEREAAYWRGIATGKGQDPSQQQPAQPAAKPTPDKFADYAEYIEALTDWKTDQKVSQALAAREAQEQEARQRAEAEARATTWAERQQAVRAALPDYDEVLSAAADIPVTAHVREVLLDSEQGPRIAYHLAQHPDEAARINALPPLAAARELGRLEAALTTAPKPPAPRTVSNAPPPITPVRGTGGRFEKAPESMTDSEWWASRKKA